MEVTDAKIAAKENIAFGISTETSVQLTVKRRIDLWFIC